MMVSESRQEREGPMEDRVSRMEEWMDERCDRFDAETKLRFKAVDERFDRVEAEMKLRFGQVDKEMGHLRVDIKDLRAENKAMLQAMSEGFARVHSNMFFGFATVVAALMGTAAF
ncbi:MAG TPA: hypothetical protein VJU14_00100 [Solirubrobacterales bacterium]|nr:hypothetical protein [Solirubrobacterales bacterium]